jgi:RTX calcium-binding nonapeptide repeat (4 copies)
MRRLLVAAAVTVAGFVPLVGAVPAAHASPVGICDGITVVGTPQADRLTGTVCDDTLYGLGGNDTLRGRLGYDRLFGGRGNDLITDNSFLFGGEIRGGAGWDICIVSEDSDVQIFGCEVIEEL